MSLAGFERQIDVFTTGLRDHSNKMMRQQVTKVLRETVSATSPPPTFRFNIGGQFSSEYRDPTGDQEVIIQFDHRREVAQRAITELISQSPHVSGEYVGNFVIFVDGAESNIMDIRAGKRVAVVNISDYARRLEVGKNEDGTPFVIQVKPGIVERAATKLIRKRFRKISDVVFGYTDKPDPWIIRGQQAGTSYINNLGLSRMRPKKRGVGEAVRYPAVFIGELNYEL